MKFFLFFSLFHEWWLDSTRSMKKKYLPRKSWQISSKLSL